MAMIVRVGVFQATLPSFVDVGDFLMKIPIFLSINFYFRL